MSTRHSKFKLTVFAGFAIFTVLGAGELKAQATAEAETAEAPDVAAIVDRANQTAYYQGADGKATVTMTITDAQGRTRNREFIILRRDEAAPESFEKPGDSYCGDQKMYVYFQRPADVNKMVFMVWKHVAEDRNDDRWLYLPALDLVKRIAASDKRTSFVGSHFFYEDVSGRTPELDNHELVEATDTYFLLKSTPKNPKQVEFNYYKTWIHRATHLPYRTEYYRDNDDPYRVYEALEVKDIQGYQTIVKAKMSNLEKDGSTILEYNQVEYDIGLPEDIFSERYLRRAPRKYLR